MSTFVNALILIKQLEDAFDEKHCDDLQNMKRLSELITEIDKPNDLVDTRIHSNYLGEGFEVFSNNRGFKVESCKLEECKPFQRINNMLQTYHSYTKQYQKQKNVDIDMKLDDNYKNTDILNDFNHLMLIHAMEFENIYDLLIQQTNANTICQLDKCLLINRNERDRTTETKQLYFVNENEHPDIIRQQLIDRIHSYYFHSFDCGFKLTRKEKENIFESEVKISDDNEQDAYVFDRHAHLIVNLMKEKRSQRSNISQLTRINNSNNKFSMQIDKKHNENEYSYGVRYFYWTHYENNVSTQDDVHRLSGTSLGSPPDANPGYKLMDWYICAKYHSFKEELSLNQICCISLSEWNNLLQKAQCHMETNLVRGIKCPRTRSAQFYDMQPDEKISAKHLMSMMIYCNFTELQCKFSETFRHKDKNETDVEMKQRHRNFFYLGKLLRECVECFGTKWKGTDNINISLYHGVSQQFSFSSLNAFIKGPLSTTTDFAVACNFCQNKGMILNINMDVFEWRYKYNEGDDAILRLNCFECNWVSDYVNEQEILFIGGLCKFIFNTIIVAPTG
eukprot:241747_1